MEDGVPYKFGHGTEIELFEDIVLVRFNRAFTDK
jgi:hypothetical protein